MEEYESSIERQTVYHSVLQLVFLSRMAFAQWVDANPVSREKTDDGAILTLKSGYLRFQVCSDSILHVVYSPEPNVSPRVDFALVKKSWQPAEFFLDTNDTKIVTLRTKEIRVRVERETQLL